MSTDALILSIDIGSSSTRAMLFDRQARPILNCVGQVSNRMQTETSGQAVFEAQAIFEGVIQSIDQVLTQAGPLAQNIVAVGMDTFVSNILGLDAQGQPITPIFTYADTQNAPDVESIKESLGPEGVKAVHERTGCLLHTSYLPARFSWLARTQPEIIKNTKRWLSIGEYVYLQLFGECQVSYSVASWNGLLNRKTLTWDESWLARLPIDQAQLSPLGDINQGQEGLLPPWAERWPSLKNIPWYPALGDGAAVNIGSGCDAPNRVALTIGSTGATRVVVEEGIAQAPEGLWIYRVDGRRALLGGATTEGGNLFAWLRDTLHLPNLADLDETLRQREADGHGLQILPFIAGERAPGWQGDAKASIIGLSLKNDAVDIVQAALEAIAYRFAIIYQRISPYLPEDSRIIASGGGLLSSPAWVQIMADVLGRPIVTLAEGEATSRGVALLALEALGLIEHPSDLPPQTGQIYEPKKQHYARYQEALSKQVRLYNKLILDP